MMFWPRAQSGVRPVHVKDEECAESSVIYISPAQPVRIEAVGCRSPGPHLHLCEAVMSARGPILEIDLQEEE
jgi:hypothetical protein